jgi:hypothetical protein
MDDATLSITTGAANAQYPLSNLKLESTTRKFRSTGNTVVVEVDLLQTRDIDTVAVVGDATTTMGFTALTVKTSVTNDFSLSPAIPISLESEQNIGFEFFTEVSHRYVQLSFTGNGSYAEVSNIFIGKALNLPLNSFSINSFRYRHEDMSSNQFNDYGQQYSHVRSYQKRLVGTIEYCTKDEQEELDTMFLRHGRHSPLWVIVDPSNEAMNDGRGKLSMYSYMEKMPSWNAVGGQLYNAALELNQVI